MLAKLQAELSRCMYSEHGLEPLMRPAIRAGVPLVDSGVELHAWIGAFPSGFGELAEQLAGFDLLN